MKDAMVSIFFFTYNHEAYIAQGIESVLQQETNIPYKLYVYDDFSTDCTAEIVQKYVSQYPDLVRLVRNTENHGINYQFEKAMMSVNTKYACLTGGDDYWYDNCKLQKQIDFLESHPDYSMVHTNCIRLNENTGKELLDEKKWSWKMPPNRMDRLCSLFLNKMNGGYPSMTSSCYRLLEIKKCIEEHPEIIRSHIVGEGTTILTAVALYGGNIGFLREPTVVYRVREGSLSHKKNGFEQINYLFSYTELRLQVLKGVGIAQDRYVQVARELLKKDILTSISLGFYEGFKSIVADSTIEEELKDIFIRLYLKYGLLNKYKWLNKILTLGDILINRIRNLF